MEVEKMHYILGMTAGQEALFAIVAIILYNVFIYYFTQTDFASRNSMDDYWFSFLIIPMIAGAIGMALFGIYYVVKFIVVNW